MTQIKIEIGLDGQVKFDVQGVKGKKCLDLTRELEKALGNTKQTFQKVEMFAKEVVCATA